MDKDTINVAIGRNIRAFRISRGMTQKALADAMDCNISQQYINRLEKGTLSLVPEKAVHIAKVFDVNISELYQIDDESDGLFSDDNVAKIIAAYNTLPNDKQKIAISEVMKCLSDHLRGL